MQYHYPRDLLETDPFHYPTMIYLLFRFCLGALRRINDVKIQNQLSLFCIIKEESQASHSQQAIHDNMRGLSYLSGTSDAVRTPCSPEFIR